MKNQNSKIVEIVNDNPQFATFQCKKCGQKWCPALGSGTGGYFRRGSWQCPRGCKKEDME